MTAKTLEFIRQLVRDNAADADLREISDGEIENVVRSSLYIADKVPLKAKYSHARKAFRNTYGHTHFLDGMPEFTLENGVTVPYGTVIFVGAAETVVPAADYSVEPISGEFYFPVERSVDQATSMLATYAFCKPYEVAAQLLSNLASEYARMAAESQVGNLKVKYNKVADSLLTAASALGGISVSTAYRGDRVNG